MFLGDIWSAQNYKIFEQCVSVRPSVCGKHDCVRTQTWKFAHRLLLPIRWLVLKMRYIGTQGPVPPILVKSIYWGLEDMEHPIHTKFDLWACIQTLNNTTKNNRHWSTESDTSHISQIGILGSWAHRTSYSHKIWYLSLYTNSK